MDDSDEIFSLACARVRESGRASNTFLQKQFGIGTGRARALLARMEAVGLISPPGRLGEREVYPALDKKPQPKEPPMSAQEDEPVIENPPPGIPDDLAPNDAQEAAESREADLTKPHNVQTPGSNMVSGDELRTFFERIEKVRADKKKSAAVEAEIFAELKSRGYEAAVVRNILKVRTQTPSAREEQIAITEVYMAAVGMLNEPPLLRHMTGLGVDPAVKEHVVAALKMITPLDGEIVLRSGGAVLRFVRGPDGVKCWELNPSDPYFASPPGPGGVEVMPEPFKPDSPDITAEDARAMGRDARKGDLAIADNPFPFGDLRRREWDAGWRLQDAAGAEVVTLFPKDPEE